MNYELLISKLYQNQNKTVTEEQCNSGFWLHTQNTMTAIGIAMAKLPHCTGEGHDLR